MSTAAAIDAGALEEHRSFLWGLCYRMTGSSADADDLVQDTFVRAMERPPARTDEPWRPWLVRVAMNLARDSLRRRRRRRYVGPWLPAPVETGGETVPPAFEPVVHGVTTEGRYELMESVTFAFLLALEKLSPLQRAVLLLRDVFDYTVRETADALGISEANVKTTHHRARRAMRDYDGGRCLPTAELRSRTRAALARFVESLATGDVAAVERLLAEDVRMLSDGGGEFLAARVPVLGRARVAKIYAKLSERRVPSRVELREVNGLPAVVVEFGEGLPREATRVLVRVDVTPEGLIGELHTVLATPKLAAIR